MRANGERTRSWDRELAKPMMDKCMKVHGLMDSEMVKVSTHGRAKA